jgi:hypothetical protein
MNGWVEYQMSSLHSGSLAVVQISSFLAAKSINYITPSEDFVTKVKNIDWLLDSWDNNFDFIHPISF